MKSNLLMFRLPEFCCRNSYISWLLLYLFGAVPQNDLRGSLSGSSCCRKGDPFQGPKLGSCLTLRNDLSEETHVLTKQEIFWEGAPRQRAAGKGTQENCLVVPTAMWLAVSGFMVMELFSGLSLANHLRLAKISESFLVVHALFSQDGCQREGFWKVVGYVVSPFDPS